MIPRLREIRRIVKQALAEDDIRNDITTRLLFRKRILAEGVIRAKEEAILAGLPFARLSFQIADPKVRFQSIARDGQRVKPGAVLARVRGDGRSLLKAERVALNFLQHLSGVATLTRRFVEAVRGTKARILDTRKTTPGIRVLEKYAVRMGGAGNHRRSLSDGILIKDNHLALVGSVGEAVRSAKKQAPRRLSVEVETTTLTEVVDALSARADRILLDNMTLLRIREAVARINGKALTEVSGGVNLSNVRDIAAEGADFISIGGLTHSAPAVDISMEIVPFKRPR
jgi:nicotinate-nucleotide pyrophosphorylase (carboxylating)